MEQCPGEGAGYGAGTSYRTQHKLAELVTCSFSPRAQSFFAHCARWLVYQRASESEPCVSRSVLVLVRRSSSSHDLRQLVQPNEKARPRSVASRQELGGRVGRRAGQIGEDRREDRPGRPNSSAVRWRSLSVTCGSGTSLVLGRNDCNRSVSDCKGVPAGAGWSR